MIGNAADAEFIRDFVINRRLIRNEECEYRWGQFIGPVQEYKENPAGWKSIGFGTFRSAWLSPDNVVYKVQHRYNCGGQSNEMEFENIVRILTRHRTHSMSQIPRSTFYTLDGRGVMAMEFVNGFHPDCCACSRWTKESECNASLFGRCPMRLILEIEKSLGLADLHEENIIAIPEQRKLSVIDVGA